MVRSIGSEKRLVSTTGADSSSASTPAGAISPSLPLSPRMDALDRRFLFFVNAESGRGNVIYLRQDGHYEMIGSA